MIILIDMDGVICTEESTFERCLAKPIPGAQEVLRRLRNWGHTIVIYTARGWAEYRMTRDWLDEHGMVYDSLVMGKPIYDVWIDDRALRFEGWMDIEDTLEGYSR